MQSEAPTEPPKAEMSSYTNAIDQKPAFLEKTKEQKKTSNDLHIKQAELVSILLDLCDRNGSSTAAIRDALSRKHGVETVSMGSIRQALQRAVRAGDIQHKCNYRFKINPNKFFSPSRVNRAKGKKGKGKKGKKGKKKGRRGRKGKRRKGKGKKKKKGRRGRRRSRKRGRKGRKGKKGGKGGKKAAKGDAVPGAPPTEAEEIF